MAGQASGRAIQWEQPFASRQLELFAQVQEPHDEIPSTVRYSKLMDTAGLSVGATLWIEDAGCGDTVDVSSSGETQTCCTGFRQYRTEHPARPPER